MVGTAPRYLRPVVEEPQTPKPVGRVSIAGVCLFVVALVVGMEVQQHREKAREPDARIVSISPKQPEALLAAIQLGHPSRAPHSTVKRLAWLLDLLEADCPGNTRRGLAQLTADTVRELRAGGVPATPTQVLGGVARSQDIGRLSVCEPYFERYAATRRESSAAHLR